MPAPITFLISDGVLPGNESRSYVLRMILRRAARFGKLLGFDEPFLAKVSETVIEQMGGHYTDLVAKQAFIAQTITEEEERFHRTLTTGLSLLDDLMDELKSEGKSEIPGESAFHLWDTFGFPVDLTRDVAAEVRLHRRRSRDSKRRSANRRTAAAPLPKRNTPWTSPSTASCSATCDRRGCSARTA